LEQLDFFPNHPPPFEQLGACDCWKMTCGAGTSTTTFGAGAVQETSARGDSPGGGGSA
jgi:hypothetical protein